MRLTARREDVAEKVSYLSDDVQIAVRQAISAMVVLGGAVALGGFQIPRRLIELLLVVGVTGASSSVHLGDTSLVLAMLASLVIAAGVANYVGASLTNLLVTTLKLNFFRTKLLSLKEQEASLKKQGGLT